MEHETIGQELVKCVLVGDTATGKTRLVCARALNARVSLRQLLRQHVPTVWAIDQYRMYKEVLERSMTSVDGVQVSLRLWDTFGDHDKDRRFAYGRSDVILLCFSIGNKNSLMHCKTVWFPEIRRFCPDTPVVLVGCKNDLRFLCKDSTYLAYCRDRSPTLRPTRESDIVMPEQARAVAKEFGVPYYETSVFTYYGVHQVFENAIRCALTARRNQRFWMTNLKHVQPPQLQAPYCPPKKELNEVEIFPGTYAADMKELANTKYYPDLVFLVGNYEVVAHRFVVGAACPSLLFLLKGVGMGRRGSSESDTSTTPTSSECESTVDDTEFLLKPHDEDKGHINSVFSYSLDLFDTGDVPKYIQDICTRTAFHDVRILQVVVRLDDQVISVEALRSLLHFVYTGELSSISTHTPTAQEGLRNVAEIFNNTIITQYVEAWSQKDGRTMSELRKTYRSKLKSEMWTKCLEEYCCDVTFELENGNVTAHRALLMSRSEVMRAMFSGDFKERRSSAVSIPDIKCQAFHYFLEYLYTDCVTLTAPVPSDIGIGMQLLELANRLCLTRLINLVENGIISDLTHKQNQGIDVVESCIRLLEPAQLHNIEQLAQWCLIQLSTNYDIVCRKHGKLFRELGSENRQWISQYRWPPVWYVKDYDYYQRALLERYRSEHPEKKKKNSRKRNNSGCLCFPGKSRRNSSSNNPENGGGLMGGGKNHPNKFPQMMLTLPLPPPSPACF